MSGLVILGDVPSESPRVPADLTPPPAIHLLPGDPPLVFVVKGSQLFEVDQEYFEVLSVGEAVGPELLDPAVQAGVVPVEAAPLGPITAISLNIAQSCNLSCSYCYADEGRFGLPPGMMSAEVAKAAVDQLLNQSQGLRVTVGFIGGEPFVNRKTLYATVEYALERAAAIRSTVKFSVTTNATLLQPEDLDLLRKRGFAVSVSLDGSAEVNDQNRRSKNGSSSFGLALRSVRALLEDPGNARIAARATITRRDLRVLEQITALRAAGFHEVGVSPLRTSAAPDLALVEEDWPVFLAEMVRAGEDEWRRLCNGENLCFSNLAIALKQLHSGDCKPLPCGSAASYISVGARGEYFTCHRTVEDAAFALGSTAQGLSQVRRELFLRSRHVDTQLPCRACWARYLCGGGCHAEVIRSGRSGCDYIRGWLDYCLRFYDKALRQFPGLFHEGDRVQ